MTRVFTRAVPVAFAVAVAMSALSGCGPDVAGPTDGESGASGTAQPSPPSAPTAWLQYVGGSQVEIRALGVDGRCPAVTVDGQTTELGVRAPAEGAVFPQPMCSAPVDAGATRVEVSGRAMPALPAPGGRIARFAVVGDAGCRVESGKKAQDCHDPAKWPAAQVAAQIAAADPDLVIHVGDYYYRESPCPEGETASCGGEPFGSTEATIRADFLTPFAPALAAAPWVMVRGNHEACRRGADLWFRYLAPQTPPTGACPEYSDPYAVDVGDQRVVVMDDSAANDSGAKAGEISHYARQLTDAGELSRQGPGGMSWLALHRPVWAAKPSDGQTVTLNATMEKAVNQSDPQLSGVQALLSGHIHALGSFAFADRPPQLVSGGGGASLVGQDGDYSGLSIGGMTAKEGAILRDFGFVLFTRTDRGWQMSFRDVSGAQVATCDLVGRSLECT